MSPWYFLRQAFPSDPKDTWRIASQRAFDLKPAAETMAVVLDTELTSAQAEVARLRGALEKISAFQMRVFDSDAAETEATQDLVADALK